MRVFAVSETGSDDSIIETEDGVKIGHFRPSNDGGLACWSDYAQQTRTVTSETEAIKWVFDAYRSFSAQEATHE